MINIANNSKYKAQILFLLLSLINMGRISALEPLILNNKTTDDSLGTYMETLEVNTHSFTIFEATHSEETSLFKPSHDEIPNFGYNNKPFWIRFDLKNEETESEDYLLVFKNTTMDHFDVYSSHSEGYDEIQKAGRQVLLSNRKIPHRYSIIPFTLTGQEKKHFYIRLEGLSMQIPLYIYKADVFYAEDHREQFFWGIYFGLNFVMALYNFFIFLYGKDLSYLFISFFIFCFNMFIFFFNGFGQEYFSYSGFMSSDSIHVFFGGGLSSLTALLFIRKFLDVDQLLPKLHKLYKGIFILNGIMILLVFITPASFFLPLSSYFTLLVVSFVLITAILALRKGSQHAVFYLIAWLGFLTSLVPFLLKEFGVIQPSFLSSFGMQIGSSILVLLLSLGVAYKIRIIQMEKERVQDQSDTLIELDKSKSAFFSNVTHEFRTPLSNISASVDSLIQYSDLPNNPKLQTFIKIIRRNCNQLLNLVNTFLSFSQFDEGKLSLHKKNYDIERLINYYCASLSSMAEMKGVQLSVDQKKIQNKIICLDPNLFEFALINILSNALKFTDSGDSIRVSLKDTKLPEEKSAVRISIEDTGIGIPEEQIPKIFNRFYQVEDSASRKYEGSGLGLPLSKEIVLLHGGIIDVQSSEGVGSTFSITLPIEFDLQSILTKNIEKPSLIKPYRVFEYPSSNSSGKEEKIQPKNSQKKGIILIVEDNQDLSLILNEYLCEDYTVRLAQNGLEAIEDLHTNGVPDLIISDIMMPRMNGKELFQSTRAYGEWKKIPFIFLTARASHQEKLEFLAEGAVDYLYKPFSAEELLLKIARQISEKIEQRNELIKSIENRVMRVLHPELELDSSLFNIRPGEMNLSILTKREREIVRYIADGLQDKEIGEILHLSVRTVSNNLHKLYKKLAVSNRIELLKKLGEEN